jgi:hypothetical protein
MMKKLFYLAPLMCSILFTVPSYGQDMPQGNLIVVTACSIAHGYTVNDVMSAARAIDYAANDNGPNVIFYRRPMTGNNAPADRLMRVVYWRDMAHWASSAGGAPGAAGAYLNSILSCDNANRNFQMNYNVAGNGGYGGGARDSSMVLTRSCVVKPELTIQEVYTSLTELDRTQRQPGDNTTMQLSHRFLGPLDGIEMGTLITIRLVGESPEALARRLDALEKPQGTPAAAPVLGCMDGALFNSFVAYWRR